MTMKNKQPFQPIDAAGVKVTVTGTTASGALVLTDDQLEREPISVRLTLDGTDNAWIAFGGSGVVALNSGVDMYMLTGTTEVVTLPGNKDAITHVAAIADGTTCTLHATVGFGI